MKPLVIYHGNCLDGFTAAWVMRGWLLTAGRVGDFFAAHYAPQSQRVELPDVTDRHVWIVDFCPPRAQLLEVRAAAARLVVLDHHKTAQAACDGLDFCTFDMERSGAMLAWDHCYPNRKPPWLVQYVQDRDLWRFALPHSRAVNAFLQSQIMAFATWDHIDELLTRDDAAVRGSAVVNYIDRYVDEMKLQARRVRFAGYDDIPVVNAPYISVSELGNALAREALFAVAWFQNSSGTYTYSLRSIGDFDVSELARKFGGGGHRNAAGFTVPSPVLE